MCIECIIDHKDYNHEFIDGTNKKIYELLSKAVKVLTERKDFLVDLTMAIK